MARVGKHIRSIELKYNHGEFLIGSHSTFRDITNRHAIIRLVLVLAIVDWPDTHLDAFKKRYQGESESAYCQAFFLLTLIFLNPIPLVCES